MIHGKRDGRVDSDDRFGSGVRSVNDRHNRHHRHGNIYVGSGHL